MSELQILQKFKTEPPENRCLASTLAEKFLSDRQTAEKYREIIDSSFCGICLSNRKGELLYANKSYLDMVGCEKVEDVAKYNWLKVISDEDKERVTRGFEKYLKMRLPKFWDHVEYQNLKTGEKFKKTVICSIIQENGYSISVMPENFEVPKEFIHAYFP